MTHHDGKIEAFYRGAPALDGDGVPLNDGDIRRVGADEAELDPRWEAVDKPAEVPVKAKVSAKKDGDSD